jgi:hypothetical protein
MQNFYEIRVWPFKDTVVIKTAELAVGTIHAQHVLEVIQCLECGCERAFCDLLITMIGHQGDFAAQCPGSALNALERSGETSGQPGQGSSSCREHDELTAVHGDGERLIMPIRVSMFLPASVLEFQISNFKFEI